MSWLLYLELMHLSLKGSCPVCGGINSKDCWMCRGSG